MVTVAARRQLVRFGHARGLSERRALRMAQLSGSVLRYERRADRNQALRTRIVDMAHRHRRYGYRMIHLRLRHEGWAINLKRVRRLYRLENPMVRRRRRKKVALGERQPLVRPSRRNEVWSVDFVFDRLAEGRSLKKDLGGIPPAVYAARLDTMTTPSTPQRCLFPTADSIP